MVKSKSPIIVGITVLGIISIMAIGIERYSLLQYILGISENKHNNNLDRETAGDTKTVGNHTPGFPLIKSNGDLLDPIANGGLENAVVDPMKYLREFNYGRVSVLPNGTTLREFTLIASDDMVKEISPGVFYNVWTFNGSIPGPTIRATEGDIIRINFINNGSKPHSIHTHGIHPSNMDGVFEMVGPKGKFTYEFIAKPFGVFPYHCHMTPLEEHIGRGLYGVYIVDPKSPREPADEMVMMMNGYDTDFDTENNFYTVNGIPYYYMDNPIQIEKDRPVRIYLVNMLEFDQINNFHLHANMFDYYPSGSMREPDEYTDIVTMSQGERGILEFNYTYPGKYMFHAHKTEFAEKGWMGLFFVNDNREDNSSTHYNNIVTYPDTKSRRDINDISGLNFDKASEINNANTANNNTASLLVNSGQLNSYFNNHQNLIAVQNIIHKRGETF